MKALIAEVRAAWRDAERTAARTPRGSSEWTAARERAERLRKLYEDLTSEGSSISRESARAVFSQLVTKGS
jgi:hypothetical protein